MIGQDSGEMVIVLTTLPSLLEAEKIANRLIEQRLAACVQIDGPLQSVYRWEEKVCRETEYRCVIKTLSHRLEKLESILKELHPYELPQIVVLEGRAEPGYYHWLSNEIG